MNPNQQQIDNLYAQAQGVQSGINQLARNRGVSLKKTSTGYSAQPITTNQLQPTQPFNLNLPTPRVPSSGLESAITGSVASYRTQAEQDRAMREASQTDVRSGLDRSINQIMGLNEEIGNVESTVDRTAEDTARKEADRYTSEIEAEQQANLRKIQKMEKNPTGMLAGALDDEINRVNRDSLSKQADLAILQNSALRNYTTAKDIADREVQNKLEPLKIKLENLKFFYQENKELFNKEDERLYNEKIKSEERAYQKEENLQNQIMNLKLEGVKSGSLNRNDLAKLSQAKSYEEAFDIVLKSWKNPSSGVLEAPTVKTINGVDMQWNGSTGQWETIGAGGVDTNKKSIDQLKFLQDTTARAYSLAGASGKSGIARVAGEALVGDTRFNRLENETDTLRTNILTLMTDPAIKKFFGPQMTNNDVRLMTSAGTTLNPKSQSKKDMQNELKRLAELFNRMQTAVNNGGLGGNVITGPDGQTYEVVD